jgi:hypothetical protein
MTATEVTVEAATITEKAAASQTKLSSSGLDVNNGAFTVI